MRSKLFKKLNLGRVKTEEELRISLEKYRKTISERYSGKNTGWLSNGRLTRINNGYISENKEDFLKYRKDVRKLTKLEEVKNLVDYDKVDNHCHNIDAYHVDHIVSVLHCFNNNIHPAVCASIHNLRCIHWKENLSKSSKSDMTINELLEKYNATLEV